MSDRSSAIPPYRYDAKLAEALETRWQAHWEQNATFRQPNPGEPGFDASKPKFYCLDMFPYPSGAGLHVGHPEGYTATDIVSRYKRMRGFNVLHPMGWDAFGLPAEQYAIQTGVHPAKTTRTAIDAFRRQLKRFGFCYDWSREVATIDPEYYRWTQWIFLQMYDAFYDAEAGRGRPIAELIEAFEKGQRSVRMNPHAAELSEAEKAQTWSDWKSLDAATRKKILDSWRLAYVGEQTVNWCPKLGTVLANEEVIDGKSERGGHPVYRKPLKQWLFRITAYADRLLEDLGPLDWPESTKTKQSVWIGRSEGAEIDFPLARKLDGMERLRVFTTRPDTLFGATYMVVAPEHPLVTAALQDPDPGTDVDAVRRYVEAARHRSDLERQADRSKSGCFIGCHAINPATGKQVPVWTSDYVLMSYGHGAIMAVPAHDARDWEFAETFELPIVQVVEPADGSKVEGCFEEEGRNVASASDALSLDGLPTEDAKARVVQWLEQSGRGQRKVTYKLRDWLFSRQRYWGEPFPVVFDADGNHWPVRDDALPVTLPELEDYQPDESEDPKPLLAKAEGWVHTTAGEAGVADLPREAKVERETNTMPGWAGSCWYFLRYCDPRNDERLVGEEADRYWMGDKGVDLYIGGSEHAVLHLLYARFWHKALYDLGHVSSNEPFHKLYHQGLITSFAYQREDKSLVPADQVEEKTEGEFIETATGENVHQVIAKMSKSLKNVVNPDDVIQRFGADTFRLYEMYMGPLDVSKPWNMKDIHGLQRFLQRAWRLVVDEQKGELALIDKADDATEKALHRTIAKVEDDLERLAFNTAIASLIKLVNQATSAGGFTKDQTERFAKILAPFVPHFAEELWSKLGHAPSIVDVAWPAYDEAMLRDDEIEIPVQIKGKVRSRIRVAPDADKKALEEAALADERIKGMLEGKTLRKVIAVPGRMVNIVAD